MAASAPRRASFADVLARGSADAPRSPGTQRRRPGAGPAAAVALSDALLARLSPSPAAEAARGALVAAVQAALGAAFPACLVRAARGAAPAPGAPQRSVTLSASQVVAFGSVPLKTYLPDGDIDLSLVGPVSDDAWPARVLQALSAQGGALGLTDAFAVHAEARATRAPRRGRPRGGGRGAGLGNAGLGGERGGWIQRCRESRPCPPAPPARRAPQLTPRAARR